MWLRIKIAVAFATCIALPLAAGWAAIIWGSQYTLRDVATHELQASTAAATGAIEERLAQDLANLKAWSALPVMQDVLIADDGGDIARVIAAFKASYPDFSAFSVTDSRGLVVASTIHGEKGSDLSADEGFRTAATGRVFQSGFGFRSTTRSEEFWFTVPILAYYDKQTVVGTLAGVIDFSAVAKAVATSSALAALSDGASALILERRDGRPIFASRTDANLLQALTQLEGRHDGVSEEVAWGEKRYFVATLASRGKGLVRDIGFVARGVAPTESVFAASDFLGWIYGIAAGMAALGAMYLAWRWTTPLVELTNATARIARGDTTAPVPVFRPRSAFAEMARALEVFRQTRIVRDRIAAREQELSRANQEHEAAARAKSEHLASLSREIRTQLTTIIGMSELINRESLAAAGTVPTPANEKYIGYAKDIGRSGVHLLAVINDLYDLSEAEAGHLKLDDVALDIGGLARESVEMMREAAQKAKVAVVCDGCDEPTMVRADAHKMKQVLFNLLSNAVKFTPENGLVRVGVRVLPDGRTTISIKDNGIGMHVNLTPVAMIPFSTGDASNHGRHGAGLGLPLVRQLVELHEGKVEIASEIGKGTTVTVTLPSERLVPRDNVARFVA